MTEPNHERRKQRNELIEALHRNGQKRWRAESDLDQVRDELAELLARGNAGPWPLVKIAVMAREAGISRETAHKLLRRQANDA